MKALKRITSSVHTSSSPIVAQPAPIQSITAISAITNHLASLKALSVATTSNEHDEETVKLIVELSRSKGATDVSLTGHMVGLQVAEQISSGHLPLHVTKGGVKLGLAERVPTILAQLIGDQSGELPCYIKQAQVLDENDRLGIWITNKSCADPEKVFGQLERLLGEKYDSLQQAKEGSS